MKRRDILKAGSGALALSGLIAAPAGAAVSKPPFAWSSAQAKKMVGQTFWLNHPERRALKLVLKAVTLPKTKQARMDTFSLQFDGVDAGVTANTYEFDHAAAGRFSMYLVPATPGPRNKRYRAEFNLLA
jgi:hypothetical protein